MESRKRIDTWLASLPGSTDGDCGNDSPRQKRRRVYESSNYAREEVDPQTYAAFHTPPHDDMLPTRKRGNEDMDALASEDTPPPRGGPFADRPRLEPRTRTRSESPIKAVTDLVSLEKPVRVTDIGAGTKLDLPDDVLLGRLTYK